MRFSENSLRISGISQDCSEAVREIFREQSQLVVVKNHANQTSTVQRKYSQLNFYDLFDQYELEHNVENTMAHESEFPVYGEEKPLVDITKNVLISLVKDDNKQRFANGMATLYYTGKKFPSTVALNELYYFVPYIKGKGIRDLYFIRGARLGYRKEGIPKENKDELRLVFDIRFVKHLYEVYKPVELEIWHTFTDTTLKELIS